MAETNAPVAAAPAAPAAVAPIRSFWQSLSRMLIMYFVITAVLRYMNPHAGQRPAGEQGAVAVAGGGEEVGPQAGPKQPELPATHFNTWRAGENMELWIYLGEHESFWEGSKTNVMLIRQPLKYIDDYPEIAQNFTVKDSQFPGLFRNETDVWVHAFLTRNAATPKDAQTEGNPDIVHAHRPMTRLLLESKSKLKKNLISGESLDNSTAPASSESTALATTSTELQAPAPLVRRLLRHWIPDLSMRIVYDHTAYPRGSIPPHMLKTMKFDSNDNYYPTLLFHDFWVVKDRTIIVNESVSSLPVHLNIAPMGMLWWQLFAAVDQNFEMQEKMGAMDDFGRDEIKKILLEGNPYLLAVTMVVSLLHTVFDMLAFKNEITFWNKVDSLEGLSVRSIFLSVFCQGVVFLYLLDNETSMMILFSSGIGLAIEIWKIKKACDVQIDRSGRIPMIRFKDRSTYVSKTRVYDQMAMRYLGWVLYPLVFGYSIYSVVHGTHRSWYSWVLSTLVGSVYTFGFIMMTPQLFINYKLKSVAHLPWKAMTYKFLNTIIDDLFAFVITMPLMHRLSCFRDDLIFLIYLYQRWIYRVDMTRVNEYGQVGDREAFEKLRSGEKKAAATIADTPANSSESAAVAPVIAPTANDASSEQEGK